MFFFRAAQQTNKFFEFSDRGMIEVKGKGIMHTFFLECNRSKTVWEIIDRPRGTLSIQLELKGLNLDIRIKKCLSFIVTFCRQYRKSLTIIQVKIIRRMATVNCMREKNTVNSEKAGRESNGNYCIWLEGDLQFFFLSVMSSINSSHFRNL